MPDPVSVMVEFIAHKAALMQRVHPELRIERLRIGQATVFTCAQWPRDIGFNRAYGVDATQIGHLSTIAGTFSSLGLRPLLELDATLIDAPARSELGRLGLRHLWDVAELSGDATSCPDPRQGGLSIHRAGPSQAEAFAELGVTAYEHAPSVRPEQQEVLAEMCRDPDSHCLIASQGSTACAIGILTTDGEVAHFNGAATLPAFRKRGCQGALLNARIELGHQLGLHDFFARTMSGSVSQGNLERYGLTPRQIRQVWGLLLASV